MHSSTSAFGTHEMSAAAESVIPTRAWERPKTPWDLFWPRFKRDRAALLGMLIVVTLMLMAVVAPFINVLDSSRQDLSERRAPPSRDHPFGRDHLGRDILSRVAHGARYTLGAAGSATLISLVVGTTVGLAAGYWGRWLDEVSMRIVELMLAFPYLLLAILIVAILGPGLGSATVAVGITKIPHYARVTRGTALQVRQNDYVEAARALGASDRRIVLRHILPNVMAPVLVLATVGLGADVLSIAGLGFLGLGAQPPIPEWGLMVSEGRSYLFEASHIIVFPGVFLMLLVLGFNLFGDGLRDALDPGLRGR
jgi:peptide/nickel transport system permease protein